MLDADEISSHLVRRPLVTSQHSHNQRSQHLGPPGWAMAVLLFCDLVMEAALSGLVAGEAVCTGGLAAGACAGPAGEVLVEVFFIWAPCLNAWKCCSPDVS